MPTPPSFTPVKLELTEQVELGYLPLRDDFDRVSNHFMVPSILTPVLQEYENDAESSITGLTITEDDKLETGKGVTVMLIPSSHHLILLALQLTQLDMYNKVLMERQKRKKYGNIITGIFFLLTVTIVLPDNTTS